MPPNFLPRIRETVLRIPSTCAFLPYGTITLYRLSFQRSLGQKATMVYVGPVTPHPRYISATDLVLTVPRSVALTDGISIDFFSCRY